ncbi:hypothetical protein DPMN_172968 [Dreissena polymorpha]|uniref:Uncharacterized protein n=1 Tax=Dreissena polymorpha TaxID=45954 RepID=A0A9D4E0R6_DREPO|nr:hypothetical protein DPMN_172968 [Dreissena polymorpha]
MMPESLFFRKELTHSEETMECDQDECLTHELHLWVLRIKQRSSKNKMIYIFK